MYTRLRGRIMKRILEDPFTFALIWVLAIVKIALGFVLGYWVGWWHNYWLGMSWFCDNPQLWMYVVGGINGIYSLTIGTRFSWLFFIDRNPPPNGNDGEVMLLKAA